MPELPSDPHRELHDLEVEERRRHLRVPSAARVSMRMDAREFSGTARDLSAGGLLFLSPGDVRLTLVIDDAGKRVERTGRLVRALRLRGESFGWAVEFDPE
jgi:PilZ domain